MELNVLVHRMTGISSADRSMTQSLGWRTAGLHVRYDGFVAALDKGWPVAVKKKGTFASCLFVGRRNGRQRSFLVLKYGFESGCWGDGREKRRTVVELEKRFCLVKLIASRPTSWEVVPLTSVFSVRNSSAFPAGNFRRPKCSYSVNTAPSVMASEGWKLAQLYLSTNTTLFNRKKIHWVLWRIFKLYFGTYDAISQSLLTPNLGLVTL